MRKTILSPESEKVVEDLRKQRMKDITKVQHQLLIDHSPKINKRWFKPL